MYSDAPPCLLSIAPSRMGRMADCSRRFLCLFAVSLCGGRVGLGLFMLALLVVMGRLQVMMGRYVMVRGRLKVLLDCF